MLIVSWWFVVLIVNCLFYDLIKSNDNKWLGIGLTAIDLTLIILLFTRGI